MSKAIKRAKERYWLEPNNIETHEKYAAYIEGYHQAEKDLELTWEDIGLIIEEIIYNNVPDDWGKEQICQEVLKRFKARKGE